MLLNAGCCSVHTRKAVMSGTSFHSFQSLKSILKALPRLDNDWLVGLRRQKSPK
jgi:hypothetical protein